MEYFYYIETIHLFFRIIEPMKKKTKHSTPTPTIEELLERVQLLEKQNAELEAKLEKEKSESEAKINW